MMLDYNKDIHQKGQLDINIDKNIFMKIFIKIFMISKKSLEILHSIL